MPDARRGKALFTLGVNVSTQQLFRLQVECFYTGCLILDNLDTFLFTPPCKSRHNVILWSFSLGCAGIRWNGRGSLRKHGWVCVMCVRTRVMCVCACLMCACACLMRVCMCDIWVCVMCVRARVKCVRVCDVCACVMCGCMCDVWVRV